MTRQASQHVWLDVGAHEGQKTFAAAQRAPTLTVYAFEPNVTVAARRFGQLPNFIMLPMAVAETNGFATFHVNACDAASSLLPFDDAGLSAWRSPQPLAIERRVTVPTVRLDTFLHQRGIERVAFLKIDAQGGDLSVVKSAGERLRDIDRIELEVAVTPRQLYRGAADKAQVIAYLTQRGFALHEAAAQSFGQEENLTFVQRGAAAKVAG